MKFLNSMKKFNSLLAIHFILLSYEIIKAQTLIRYGTVEVPTNLNYASSWGESHLILNIEFNQTYYLLGFEFYAAKNGIVQTAVITKKFDKIDDWRTCGDAANLCASYYNSHASYSTSEVTTSEKQSFSLTKGYNYCLSATTQQVNQGDTVHLWQTADVVGIDMDTTRVYSDRSATVEPSSATFYIWDIDSPRKSGFYMRALVSLTHVTYSETTTTSTTTSTTKTSTTSTSTTSTTVETTSATTKISTTTSNPTTTTAPAPIITPTSLASSTSSLATTATGFTTHGQFIPIVFNSDTLINLIMSNYSGDMSACVINCTHHGVCYMEATTNKLRCLCSPHYTGTACQTDTRACSSSPCLNGGGCFDITTLPSLAATTNKSYFCNCSSFYYGVNCEYKRNLCENVTCSGHGSCSQESDMANCTCFSNYFGDLCQFEDAALKVIQQVISVASILAIVIIILFYALFICNDFHTVLVKRQKMRQEKVFPTQKRQPSPVRKFKPVYIPFQKTKIDLY